MSRKKILAVDDEEHILDLIEYNLLAGGYDVLKAETGEDALEIIKAERPDMVLLDYMLPGIDGIEVLKAIRTDSKYKKLPVIMLTAKSDEFSKVIGLELGADDYLTKPFGVHELVARIKAVLRRTEGTEDIPEAGNEEKITIDRIMINRTTRVVTVGGNNVELSMKEFDLLYLLAKNRGVVFSSDMLLEKIWGYDYSGETRTVDVHIRNLRKKIEEDDTNPVYIKTVRGVGYKFA